MDIGVERKRTHRRRVENNFYYVKNKGESDPARPSVADNLLTGYTAYGIKRARPISWLNNGTGEPTQKWEAKTVKIPSGRAGK